MKYQWYNNGIINKKIYDENNVPEDFIKGYLLKRTAMKLVERLTRRYYEKIERYERKYKLMFLKKKEQLEQELRKKQEELTKF